MAIFTDVTPQWTIQISNSSQGQRDLAKVLYTDTLKEDPLFHLLYEPELIIRFSSPTVRERVEEWLKANRYSFFINSYPTPVSSDSCVSYGENEIVKEHLAAFTSIFHTHSVAALEMEPEKYCLYMKKVVKRVLRCAGYSGSNRALHMEYLASSKKTDFSPAEICRPLQIVKSSPLSRSNQEKLDTVIRVSRTVLKSIKEEPLRIIFAERVIHSMFNQLYTSNEEARYLDYLAKLQRKIFKLSNYHAVFKESSLPLIFQYHHIMADPKRPNREEGNYHILHSGGFIKLSTNAGRVYWYEQAMNGNRNPDWKIHFSIQEESIPLAWNTLAELFIEEKCPFGMKVFYTKVPEHMKGREITIYIFRYHPSYKGNEFFNEKDQQDMRFWSHFIQLAEERLHERGVTSNGTAIGDKPIGVYASLRNEAFIAFKEEWPIPQNGITGLDQRRKLEGQIVYPPNEAGYNAAGHEEPNLMYTKRD